MKIKLIVIGRTDETYLKDGITKYLERLKHYVNFEFIILNDIKLGKKANIILQKEMEGKLILEKVNLNDFLVLLDENGEQFTSMNFSNYIQKRMNAGNDLIFVVGGPFGFSEEIYSRANAKISLSKMTFSHQMVRLFFVEQIYRAFTILKGEKYHHH
ncbi:23S rRNA (pseudouridine(1915)-N(3))-methyltransferase RlmH [Vicingus serpentipes]|uniref:Ribosomal RNA large subunit methyltransferase H n=1 Tax=Vicingus serpentipes TaxID=1926625 RepID=A0A5C6RT39_9FLAO|nr:23S rRNA (pseudouridine(1915)-N(3))-methyltransferase RlmH [Vicingus serpentipes]TXB65511.1 23S rRNA (pseudouridine(1915)-N(3))-methyltransferase RlmH [Vicingus serpentipes]